MNDKVWHVNSATKSLESAYELQANGKSIVAAQPFSVSLKSVMVADDLDGWPRGDNDLLLITNSSLGEAPKVQRVHFYAEEIAAKTVLKTFYGETMFICDDYSGTDRLFLEIRILEIDTDTGERKALKKAFTNMAGTAGVVFPVVMPYAALASGVLNAVEKLISALEKNVAAIECPLALYPPDRPDAGMPLQTGVYVVFSEEVDGTKYQLDPNFTLKANDNREISVAYAVFEIEPLKTASHKYVVSQKVATLLTQIDQGNENSAAGTMEFLIDTIQQYSNFKDLQRYADLKAKDKTQLTNEEQQLMDQIAKRNELKPFLPA